MVYKLVYPENRKRILFVCTHNVFRSLCCEVLAKKYSKENNHLEFIFDSAGTIAYNWERPDSDLIYKLKEFEISIFMHKNRRITSEIIKNSDLVVVMTNEHKNFLERKFQINSILFNKVAFNKEQDLLDNSDFNNDNDLSKESFISLTVEYINNSMPSFFNNLNKYLD